MNAEAPTPSNPPAPPRDPWGLRQPSEPTDPEPQDPHPHDHGARPDASLFDLLVDLVRAERNAGDSDKWYGDWDDTHLQRVALDEAEAEAEALDRDALLTVFGDFRIQTRMHLDVCPTLAGPADDRRRRPPTLHGLSREQVRELRDRARALRSDEDTGLTFAARHALADLYEAHAMLGDVFWDEGGCVTLAVDDIPGW